MGGVQEWFCWQRLARTPAAFIYMNHKPIDIGILYPHLSIGLNRSILPVRMATGLFAIVDGDSIVAKILSYI